MECATPKTLAREGGDELTSLIGVRTALDEDPMSPASRRRSAQADSQRRGSLYASASRARRQTLVVATPSSPSGSGMPRSVSRGAVFSRAHDVLAADHRRKSSVGEMKDFGLGGGEAAAGNPLAAMEVAAEGKQDVMQLMDELHPMWTRQSAAFDLLFKTVCDRVSALEDVVLHLKEENGKLSAQLAELSSDLAGTKPEDEVTTIFQDKMRVQLTDYRHHHEAATRQLLSTKLQTATKSKHAQLLFAHANHAARDASEAGLSDTASELRSGLEWATDARREADALRDKLRAVSIKPHERGRIEQAFRAASGRFEEAEGALRTTVEKAELELRRARCRPSLRAMWRIALRYGRTLARIKLIAARLPPQRSVVERLADLESELPRIKAQEERGAVLHNELVQVQRANMQTAGAVEEVVERLDAADEELKQTRTSMATVNGNLKDMRVSVERMGDFATLASELRDKADRAAVDATLHRVDERLHKVELHARHAAPVHEAVAAQEHTLSALHGTVNTLHTNVRSLTTRVEMTAHRVPREGTMHNIKMALSRKLEKKDVLRLLGSHHLLDGAPVAGSLGGEDGGGGALEDGALLKCLSCHRALRGTSVTQLLDISAGGGPGVTTVAPGGWFDRGEMPRLRPQSAGGGGSSTVFYSEDGATAHVDTEMPSPVRGRPQSAPARKRGRRKRRGRKSRSPDSRSVSPAPSAPSSPPRPNVPTINLAGLGGGLDGSGPGAGSGPPSGSPAAVPSPAAAVPSPAVMELLG